METTTRSLLTNRTYLFLLSAVLLMHLAGYLVIPILPVFLEKVRNLSISQIGLILGAGSIAYQVGSLLGGFFSDRLGRRNVMVIGAFIEAGAMLGLRMFDTYAFILLFLFLNGIGVGLFAPTLKAKIADVVKQDERTPAFAWRGIAANGGIIIAGLAITLLALSLSPDVFVYAAIVFLSLAVVTLFVLKNDRCVGQHCQRVQFHEYKQILTHKSFLLFSLVSLLIWALYAQFALVIPLRGEHVLGTAGTIGLIYTINSAVVVLFQGPISRLLLEKVNPYLSLVVGTLFAGAGLFAIGWSTSFFTLSVSAIVFVIGEMLFLPVLDSLVGHFAKPELLGAYFGISNVVAGVGSAVGNTLGGAMIENLGGVASRTPWTMYAIITVAFTAILGLFAYYARKRYHRHSESTASPSPLKRKEKVK